MADVRQLHAGLSAVHAAVNPAGALSVPCPNIDVVAGAQRLQDLHVKYHGQECLMDIGNKDYVDDVTGFQSYIVGSHVKSLVTALHAGKHLCSPYQCFPLA